ncbi:hypothetical protein CHU00_15870 [Sphingobacterium cellulitidis]|nr:hypothetical protein CHU00_15870 [Sphingobacterium cellulitidis]
MIKTQPQVLENLIKYKNDVFSWVNQIEVEILGIWVEKVIMVFNTVIHITIRLSIVLNFV